MATGIIGAGDYRDVAGEMGFPHLAVVDWTSSAGDWTFIVSEDGNEWFILSRENNWPSSGFTYRLNMDDAFYGTSDKVLAQIAEIYA